MTGRRCLPFIAIEGTDLKEGLSDFQLRCASSVSIEGLQHASEPNALLPGQAGIRRNCTAMQGGEQTPNGLDTVEAIKAERNHRDGDHVAAVGAVMDLEILPVAERETEISVGAVHPVEDTPDCRGATAATSEAQRGLGQHHDTGVLLRQPENGGVRGCDLGIDREIATPTADGCARSAVRGLRRKRPKPENLRHRHRSGEAIPMPGRMLSAHPDDRKPPKNARLMRQGPSQPPESFTKEYGRLRIPAWVDLGKSGERQQVMRGAHHDQVLRWLSRTSSR